MDVEAEAAARELAANALLDQAARNSRGVPTLPKRPAAEAPAEPSAEEERNALRRRHLEDVQRVRDGQPIRTGPMWMNVLCADACFALDYLQNPIVLIDQPDQIPVRVQAKQAAFQEEWAEAARRGDGYPAQKDLLYSYETLLNALQGRPVIALSDLARGLGCPGQRVTHPAALDEALHAACHAEGPMLVEVAVDPAIPTLYHKS